MSKEEQKMMITGIFFHIIIILGNHYHRQLIPHKKRVIMSNLIRKAAFPSRFADIFIGDQILILKSLEKINIPYQTRL